MGNKCAPCFHNKKDISDQIQSKLDKLDSSLDMEDERQKQFLTGPSSARVSDYNNINCSDRVPSHTQTITEESPAKK